MIRSLLCVILSFCLISNLSAQQASNSPSPTTANQQSLLNETLNFAKNHQEFKDLCFKQHEAEFVRLIRDGQNPKILFIG